MNIQELTDSLPFGGIVINPTVCKPIKLTKDVNGELIMGSDILFKECHITHDNDKWEISIQFLDFSKALLELKEGKRVYRDSWNGNNQFIYILSSGFGEHFNSTFVLKSSKNRLKRWTPSINDLLATDWIVK